jgi:hypothetical protein
MSGMRLDTNGAIQLDGVGRYVDMDKRYSPQFELGAYVTETALQTQSLSGLGSLAGTDYARADAVQKALTIQNAALNAADPTLWNQVAASLAPNAIPGSSYFFLSKSDAEGLVDASLKLALITTEGAWYGVRTVHAPTDADLANAEEVVSKVAAMVNFYVKTVPESAKKVNNDKAWMASEMNKIPAMQDPAVVGMDTFLKTLEERAKALAGGFSFGFGMVAAGAVVVGLFLLSQRVKSNPGFDVKKLVIPGALAAGAYWYFTKKKSMTPQEALAVSTGLMNNAKALYAQAASMSSADPGTAASLRTQADGMTAEAKSIAKAAGLTT